MDFSLNEEQHMLQESISRLLATECPLSDIRELVNSDGNNLSEVQQKIADSGIAGILIPEDLGGVGLTLLDAALIAETLGHAVAPVPFIASSVMAPIGYHRLPQAL